jgi:hypothetical protein
MGRKNAKGTVSIVQDGQRIRLRWRYQKKRYSLNLFQYNKANLVQARKIALQIERDLLTDKFDVTLVQYKPTAIQECAVQESKTLVEHFEEWVKSYSFLLECTIVLSGYQCAPFYGELQRVIKQGIVWLQQIEAIQ